MCAKEMTRYLKSVIAESSHPAIPFKDDNFVSLSYEELLLDEYEVDGTHPICVCDYQFRGVSLPSRDFPLLIFLRRKFAPLAGTLRWGPF